MILACSPLFMVMQHTLMADVPMLALWLAAIGCFLYATDHKKADFIYCERFFLTAAMFTGYQSFALCLYWVFISSQRRRAEGLDIIGYSSGHDHRLVSL